MLPIWLIPGVMRRQSLIKEGKLLKDQLKIAQETANTATQVIGKKPSLLAPGIVVGGGGLLVGKEIADSIPIDESNGKRKRIQDIVPTNTTMYKMQKPESAEFILGTVATIENGLASTILGLRNAKLKKQIAQAQALTDNAKLAIEQANKSLPIKLGAIGVGTTALATPAFYYLNKQNQLKNNQRINPNENL